MFRNQYDNDVTIWSPQGRIHQIEYAMEAVKQGSATVGLKSKTHAVLVALKRAQSDLVSHQKKIDKISSHITASISGLTSDARSLVKFMRNECLQHHFTYETRLPVPRLVGTVGSKLQLPTQRYGRRPFGVGILIAGYDEKGPHIFQTCPSANYYNCKAMAIGSRSQSARTYLERNIDKFADCNAEELIKHGLLALRETLPNEQQLSTKNCSISIVGEDQVVEVYEDEATEKYLSLIEQPAEEPAAQQEASSGEMAVDPSEASPAAVPMDEN